MAYKFPDYFLKGGIGLVPGWPGPGPDSPELRDIIEGLLNGFPVADVAAAQALPASQHNGSINIGGRRYRWDAASLAEDASGLLAIRPSAIAAPDPGRYVIDEPITHLELPITAATADGAILFTVPTGVVMHPLEAYWLVGTNFTGGTASTIGVSSSNKTGFTTKGDLLGGAAGDAAAALTTALSPNPGTVGAAWGTLAARRSVWRAGETFRYDRITSAFTAGAGAVLIRTAVIFT